MNANEMVNLLRVRAETQNKRGYSGEASELIEIADLIESQAAKIAELNDFLNSQCAKLLEKLGEAERRERAHEAAIKRHYADMTSQCFICYSCVNHDARGHWNGKEPYACSGCGKSHPKWRFDEGRFAQEGTK